MHFDVSCSANKSTEEIDDTFSFKFIDLECAFDRFQRDSWGMLEKNRKRDVGVRRKIWSF